ncbi:MAG: hypothetical protein ACNYWM_06205 [Methanosarcinales archaeon]
MSENIRISLGPFDSKTNASLQVLIQFWAGTGSRDLRKNNDEINIVYVDEIWYTIPRNTSGEWVWKNGNTYSMKKI